MQYTTNFNLKKPDLSDAADIGDINDNMDTLDSQAKKKQTAKSSPSTGNSPAIEFIATISQSDNGEISATKQRVRNAGRNSAGLISLPSGSTTTKYLREDGTWQVPPGPSVVNKGATLAWGTGVTLATVAGTNITVSMPSNPNTMRSFQIATYTLTVTGLGNGSSDSWSADGVYTATGVTPPTGYTAIGLAGVMTDTAGLIVVVDAVATGNNRMIRVKNATGASYTGNITVKILYYK